MAQDQDFTITDGPSKFDLMVSLFDGDSQTRRTVEMTLISKTSVAKTTEKILILGIEREDGSGESWLVKGYLNHHKVQGYYTSKHRKGYLSFVSRFAR